MCQQSMDYQKMIENEREKKGKNPANPGYSVEN